MKLSYLSVPAFAILCSVASAAPYDYAVWGSGNGSSLSGTVGGNSVTFTGAYDNVYTNYSGGYYDQTPSDYISSTVDNAPAVTDNFIQLQGGNNDVYTLSFSQPVNNLVLSFLSLGAGGSNTQVIFNTPFTILSQGPDQWGGSSSSLTTSGNTLIGNEGSGSLLFSGMTSSLTFQLPDYEYWYGLTVATPAATPEPSSFAALGLGAGALALIRRRRK